jgi:tungstate transport system substrate-binding protein
MLFSRRATLLAVAILAAMLGRAFAEDKSIGVASTTSTEDSGRFGGRRGDADVVFVHAKEQEEKFLAEGYGVKRYPVMYNDFVLVGPSSDPARIKNTSDIVAALKMIKDRQAPFVSRGDRSGTHQAELKLRQTAGIDIARDRVRGTARSVREWELR